MIPEKQFMEAAIEEAKKAAAAGDYAIGAVVIRNGEIISSGEDRVIRDENPILHAEIVAILEAAKKTGSRYLEDCILYTTHEPCPMCAAAAVWAKMQGIVSGAKNEDMDTHRQQKGNAQFTWRIISVPCRDIVKNGNPRIELIESFMRDACCELFQLSK